MMKLSRPHHVYVICMVHGAFMERIHRVRSSLIQLSWARWPAEAEARVLHTHGLPYLRLHHVNTRGAVFSHLLYVL